MKLLLALLLSASLVACAGADSVDIASTPSPAPTSAAVDADQGTDANAEATADRDSGTEDAATQPDSGEDAADAGHDSSVEQDAGSDAGQDSGPGEPTCYGVSFDGSPGQRVISNLPSDMAGQPSVTVEAWFRLDASSSQGLVFKAGAGPYLAVATSGEHAGKLATCLADGFPCVYSADQLAVGAWHHAAVSLDNGTLCLHLDGAEKGCVATSLTAFPLVAVDPGVSAAYRLSLGASSTTQASSKVTVDELRVSHVKRYSGAYATPARLTADADAKLTLSFDEGIGVTSGPATLYAGASWVTVTR